jgi:hypothetical protein
MRKGSQWLAGGLLWHDVCFITGRSLTQRKGVEYAVKAVKRE